MASISIRNLSDAAHRALRIRAAENGRSTEAEIRKILEQTVLPNDRPKFGSMLMEIARRNGGYIDGVDLRRDPSPGRAVDLE